MKNLGKTIDRIIKIDPDLGQILIPIKNKWKKYPSRTLNYWKELLEFLNSESLVIHPLREKIKDIIATKRSEKKQLYSFEEVSPSDRIVGGISEDLSDAIKKHDKITVAIAKMRTEASMTHNLDLMVEVSKKEALLEVSIKKLWINLKNRFDLWGKSENYSIKSKEGLLCLVIETGQKPAFLGPGIVKMDSTTLRQFLQYLGYDPSNLPPMGEDSN